MGFIQKINLLWQQLGLVQKALLAAAVMTCVLTAVLLTKWATKPELRLLYGNLGLEQAAKITDKINEKNIPYRLAAGGTSVYVQAEKIYELRAALAKDGLTPKSGEPGYEIFDNEKLGVSPLVQKMNYNRALQGELAKTIQVFDGVEYARVHIVRPEQTVFAGDTPRASASVILRLKPGWKLSSSSAAAIASLVCGAVEGLKNENVTIADSNGGLLTSNAKDDTIIAGANTYKDYKAAIEEQMTNRLLRSLEQVLGPGRATVLCGASLDMKSETVISTTYEKGIPTEETVDETSTIREGAANNEGKSTVPGSTEKSGTTTSKYKLPETVTTHSTTPGKILAWSVSAVVDLTKPSAQTPNSETADKETTTPAEEAKLIMSVEDVKALIRTAIGPELIKDENLTVKNVPFNQPTTAAEPVSFGYEKLDRYIEIARQSSLGLLAVCALIALKILTGAGKKLSGPAAQTATAALGPGSLQMLPAGSDAAATVRQHIAVQLRQNPEQVRQLFSTWLSEER